MGMTRAELWDLAKEGDFPGIQLLDPPLSMGAGRIDSNSTAWTEILIRANDIDLHRIHAALLTEERKNRMVPGRGYSMRRFLLEETSTLESKGSTGLINVLAEGVVFGGEGVVRDGQGKSYAWVAVHWLGQHGSGVTWDHFESFLAISVTKHDGPIRRRRIAWLD